MLVKIIAMGLNATVWKNVFHHLRGHVPDVPFAAGIFSSPDEMAYLAGDYLANVRPEDAVDLLLCDPGNGADWKRRAALLSRVSETAPTGRGLDQGQPIGEDFQKPRIFMGGAPSGAQLVLTLAALEHGIKQLIQGPLRVELLLDEKARFIVTDPRLIIPRFPADFPRIRLDDHLSTLHIKGKAGTLREVQPTDVPTGTLLGWSEIDAVGARGELLEPLDWLNLLLRAEKIKLAHPEATGIIRERQGLYLCPGLPIGRISGVVVEGITFPYLIDLGTLGGASPHFDALCEAVRAAGARHQHRWREAEAQTRNAEAKRDLPVVVGGGDAMMRETLAALLVDKGFFRCSTLAAPGEGVFREPTLLLQAGPWPEDTHTDALSAQVEEPLIVPLEADMARIAEPLDALLPAVGSAAEDTPGGSPKGGGAPIVVPVAASSGTLGVEPGGGWRALPWRKVSPGDPLLTLDRFEVRSAELADRRSKAAAGRTLAENRTRLLTQEVDVIAGAMERLETLLKADGTVQVWSGSLPTSVKQALVFSHDPEEAGAVLQALTGIAKKRWFDLAPYSDADALITLEMDALSDYADAGVMVITSASREKLRALKMHLAEQDVTARAGLKACESARLFYGEEAEKTNAAVEALARQWSTDALSRWLERRMPALLERLAVLRPRHERRWFSRALVGRVAIIPSSGENRPALLAACGSVFPGFKNSSSRVVHYDYESQQALSSEDRKALRDSLGSEPPDPETWRTWQTRALDERNKALLDAYLEVITNELGNFKADLLLIEQRLPVAFIILEHLRREIPALGEVPAVVILPDAWCPEPDRPMPWSRTRIISLSRLGALGADECIQHLRGLFGA